MASIVITPTNSDSDGISNADAGNIVLVTQGAWVTNQNGDALNFSGIGVHDISIDGTVGASNGDGIQVSAGSAIIRVGEAGYVSGGLTAGGTNAITLTGTTGSGIVNVGTIYGDILGSSGADTYDGRGGTILGTLFMGSGNDTVFGGDGVERVAAGSGNDTVDLGGGDDTFLAVGGDGNDIIDGGDGKDTYDATFVFSTVIIDLDEGLACRYGNANDYRSTDCVAYRRRDCRLACRQGRDFIFDRLGPLDRTWCWTGRGLDRWSVVSAPQHLARSRQHLDLAQGCGCSLLRLVGFPVDPLAGRRVACNMRGTS